MKAVILAGGLGSRLAEETSTRPKPMVNIGEYPILWHLMKIYSHHGVNDFIICLGYKSYVIKEFFANYYLHCSDVTFDMSKNEVLFHHNWAEPWKVTLVDTGLSSMTGGRLKAVEPFLGDEDFCFTYGDGVGDVDIEELVKFHRRHGKLATVTVARPPGRFGEIRLDGIEVASFAEKRDTVGTWVNAGFFVLSPKVLRYIKSASTTWEEDPMNRLAADRELCAFVHHGFWQPMDTVRDRNYLVELWENGKAPWKTWS